MTAFPVGPDGEGVDFLTTLRRLADLGVAHVHGRPAGMWDRRVLDVYGERVIPVVSRLVDPGSRSRPHCGPAPTPVQ